MIHHTRRFQAILLVLLFASTVAADAWPTFRHDAHRSGRTAEQLDAAALKLAWTYQSPHPPQPAWAGPAKWDAYAGLRGLKSMRNYDPVFHVVAANGKIYFGSSVDDSVHCLHAKTGKTIWLHTTNAPVRIAPTLVGDRLYFGSDDGHAYCIHASDGKRVWQFSPSPNEPAVLNNGRLISKWPVRSGVLVGEKTAYFAASLLPWKDSYLCAVDAATGQPVGPNRYVQKFNSQLTFEGPLLASDKLLIFPQGRIPPRLFNRSSGTQLGQLDGKSGGGSFVLMTGDGRVYHGPGNKGGWITASDAESRTKLATFPNAKAMVVAEERVYLLTDLNLSAIDRKTGRTIWSMPATHPHELILAGETLFTGGEDEVSAHDAATGKQIWSAPINGRAHGLTVADGSLLVSTNTGAIHSFRIDVKSPAVMTWLNAKKNKQDTRANQPVHASHTPSQEPAKIKDQALISRWVFSNTTTSPRAGLPPDVTDLAGGTVRDLAGDLNATILGSTRMVRVGEIEAIALDGGSNSLLITGDIGAAKLPTEQLTATAWVRIDTESPWGGILGAIQDNGDFERGWILGYKGRRFAWAVCGKEGPGRLTYLTAPTEFETGRWYHVAGTYDGTTMRLLVNGKQVAESKAQQGAINYPKQAFYEIGAYHDKDEYNRLNGMLHEVRLYDKVLDEKQLTEQSEELNGAFPSQLELKQGPVLQFVSTSKATVRWWTDFPSPTRLMLRYDGNLWKYGSEAKTTDHEVTIDVPRHDTVYHYQIEAVRDDLSLTTDDYECDTFFNYSMRPIIDTKTPPTNHGDAIALLKASGVRQGICLLLGCDDPELPLALASESCLRVIVFETDAKRVQVLRKRLLAHNAYGARVAVHHVQSLLDIPTVRGFANLALFNRRLSSRHLAKAKTLLVELLAPGRGVACLRLANSNESGDAADPSTQTTTLPNGQHWLLFPSKPRDGAGEWSHQYGLASNAAFGGETLGGATNVDQLSVVWIGRPGPRAQADRNGRKPSPLATSGRFYMQGLKRLIAVDSYNGTILWSLEIPGIGRFNMPRDTSNWCADAAHLFIAIGQQIWQLDAETGDLMARHTIPKGPRDDFSYEWGYVARMGHLLLGSNVKSDAPFTSFWGNDAWYDSPSGVATFKVCSDNLFSVDISTKQHLWNRAKGLIINSTITAADGMLFFVESRNKATASEATRRIGSPDLWKDLYLVGLDATTGSPLWEQTLSDMQHADVALTLAYGKGNTNDEGTLTLVSSANVKYDIRAFNAATGKLRWQTKIGWPEGKADHGTHLSRPAIVGNRLFVRPGIFDLLSGKKAELELPYGKCGTYACSSEAMLFRYSSTSMWNATSGELTKWNRLRPGCWLSTIPANGLVIAPEAGGGCSCGNWLETSIVFSPKSKEEQ